MSFQPKTNLYASPYTVNRIDDIQLYTNLAEINALDEKFVDVIYRDSSTGNQYSWNGSALIFYNNVNTGSVSSVSKSGNTISVNNTDPHNPIISTVQELNSTATPTFNEITLTTTTPSANNKAASKLYVDTLAGSSVQSVSSATPNILEVAGTAQNPILSSKIGAKQPLWYKSENPTTNAEKIQYNNTVPSSVSTIGLGISPVNANHYNNNGYISHYFDYITKYLPCYLRAIDVNTTTNYVTYSLDSLNSITGYSYIFNVTYVGSESGGSLSLVNGQTHLVIVEPSPSGQNNTASNVGSGEGLFKSKVGVDLQFKSLTATSNAITLTNNTNDIGVDVNQANLNLDDTQITTTSGGNYIAPADLKNNLQVLDSNLFSVSTTTNSKVATVGTTQTFLLDVSGTTAITLDPKNDNVQGLLYDYQLSVGLGSLGANSTTFASVTTFHFGLNPANSALASRNATVRRFLQMIETISLPMRVRLCVNTTDYAEFRLDAGLGLGVNSYSFTVTYIPGNSTISSITAGTYVYCIFGKYQPIPTAGSSKLSINNTNKETPTFDVVEANLTLNNIGGTLGVAKGGTNKTAVPTSGQLLIGNNTDYTLAQLTAGNGIYVTNGAGSIAVASDLSLQLNGAVIVNSSGILSLNASTQSGSPYFTASNILTIKSDVIITGSLTINSNSTMVVEGDLIVVGGLSMAAGSALYTRGVCHLRGASSSDVVTVQSASIVSFDEISFRNYSNSGNGVLFNSSTATTNIIGRSIVFDGNATSIVFANDTAFNVTADTIMFSNNTQANNNDNFLIYKTSFKSAVLKFINNTNSGTAYCIDLQSTDIVVSNLIEFSNNTITGTGIGFVVYVGASSSLSGDVITFDSNAQTQTASGSAVCIYLQNGCTITGNRVEFLRNYTNNSGAAAIRHQTTAILKCEQLQINVDNSTAGRYENINNSNATQANIQSQYSTGRLPQLLLYNNNATLTNYPTCSYLGVVPFWQAEYDDWAGAGTATSLLVANTFYQIIPSSISSLSNAVLSTQFQAGSTNGSIKYIGEDTINFRINLDIGFSVSATAPVYTFQLFKNGVGISGTNKLKLVSAADPESIDINKIISLAKNDELTVWVSCDAGISRLVTTKYYNLIVEKLRIM